MKDNVDIEFPVSRSLDLRPVNIAPQQLVECLSRGETVLVRLEPGDATRYDFFLVPLIGENVPTAARDGWLGLVPLNVGKGTALLPPTPNISQFDFSELEMSGYTRAVIAKFYNLLMEELLR